MTEIASTDDMAKVFAASTGAPIFVFKHSTACSVSYRALEQVAAYESAGKHLPVYIVNVIEGRPVSNGISEWLGVRHQSPQLILVESGRPVWSATHSRITAHAAATAASEFAGRS